MATWEYAGRFGADGVIPVRKFTAGVGGVAKGQPVVFGSGKVIGKTGGVDTVKIFGVAMHAAAADATVQVCVALPDVLFYAPIESGDTPAVGVLYGISTLMTVDDDNTTQVMVQVVDTDEQRASYRIVRVVQ